MSQECCKAAAHAAPCPACGQSGRRVGVETVRALVSEKAAARMPGSGLLLCVSQTCDVVYFSESLDEPWNARREAVSVSVFQKECDPARPVCYCFGRTVASIREEIRRTGGSGVEDEIRSKVKEGLCSCETKNPQGTCCLGNVNAVVKEEMALLAGDGSDVTTSIGPEVVAGPSLQVSAPSSCCSVPTPSRAADGIHDPLAASAHPSWLLGGSVAAALAASACCWLPLAFGGIGLSAAAAGAVFEHWRPALLALTAALLVPGFYVAYFRKQVCEPGSTCAAPDPGTRRLGRLGLWAATFLVVAAASFPYYASALAGSLVASGPTDVHGRQIALSVGGMSCEACTLQLRQALLKVPGVLDVSVDYPSRTARVSITPTGSAPRQEKLVGAVKAAGYTAQIRSAASTQAAVAR